MCWNETVTYSMAGLGAAATFVAWRRGEPAGIWGTIGYFTAMEGLQAWGYNVVDQCGSPGNQAVTLLSYLHITLQPIVVNLFCMALVGSAITPRIRRRVLAISALASAMLMARLIPLPQFGICPPGTPLCGIGLCTISGNWHIGWTIPLNDLFSLARWVGPIGQFPDYMLACLILPCFYGAWRFALLNACAGPMLASVLTKNPSEMPAVWCLLSVALVLIGLSPFFRRQVFPPGAPA
ncbi:DUF5765 domain-containing protein [Mameliella sediminis]|uniref:DUF5765 domain-containing protein n=1 Tax=Mameliella sediminis TaxID=2836866 RepID=UPI001C483389|nr:DUF5765 domain-containing protein [Mameliella sediminis]MBY6116243.1 hypothetical protein [Antarctobacter heliothermus]MBY6146208.1 hypothetical protein [Mameliella alba]MBV7396997.1 hypothetical protein [Mameliella sediminis]MBY6161865.1 hypothetical protein [Mameliella alba]MBY6170335.1 hypothetical protein [Mameliella alba]